jgi:glyoxylase-like metal-dependent hydrolase (beta-lactamase superfamily II)/rhodanese-related sulfurtransferase
MNIEQIYTGCLAQGAYYIESDGEIAIIDPLREVQPYLDRAERDNGKIKYIFETHFHADFVSGHVTLSKKSGAPIVFGPNANPSFDTIVAEDLQEFKIGKLTLVVLHTPGHTMESTTYLLRDENGKDHAIFSGDTLFLGDVGRPDLAQKSADMTQEDLAGILFYSLRTKIMPLADDIIVYPAHGAGSACGKNMMKETVDTLGNQKKMNYALRTDMTKEEFIKEVTDGLLPPPKYFPLNVKMNKEGYEDIADVLERGTKALSPSEFEAAANESGALVLDVRHQHDFVKGHIPRSIFIGLNGDFAPWVGALIADTKQSILLVTPEGKEEETITRLSRVGFDGTIGYLKGGFEAWSSAGKESHTITSLSAEEVAPKINAKAVPVFDVRKDGEYQSEFVVGANHTPLSMLNDHLTEFPKDKTFYVHCAGGYRSVIAASILKSRGIHNFVDIAGGFGALKKAGAEVTEWVCPSTL